VCELPWTKYINRWFFLGLTFHGQTFLLGDILNDSKIEESKCFNCMLMIFLFLCNFLIFYVVSSSYIIALVLSGEGCPFHPSILSFVPSSKFLIPGWKRRRRTMNGGRNNFIQMWSVELAHEPVGGEELGPLRAMIATSVGLSLAFNTAAAKP